MASKWLNETGRTQALGFYRGRALLFDWVVRAEVFLAAAEAETCELKPTGRLFEEIELKRYFHLFNL